MFSSFPFSSVGPPIVAASTIKITHFIHHVTVGAERIQVVEPPADGFTGPVILIGDVENEVPELEAGEGNIRGGAGIGFNEATIIVFDGSFWYPNRAF